MAEKNKANKLRARLPRGLADRTHAEIAATREMIEKIRVVYERYGFEPVETPAIEYTDALGKFLPDQDRPNEGVFSFQDDDEQWLSLRYDLTAPLARYVAERVGTENLVLPYRSYRVGWVFRNEKPGPGRFRQFMQFDADTVGSASPAADAEMCMMAADTMHELGLPRGSYVVKVNSRKILEGLLEKEGLSGEEHSEQKVTVLRAIDKLDRLGPDAVLLLLTTGRKDDSGDHTKGAGLEIESAKRIINFVLTGAAIPVAEFQNAVANDPNFSKSVYSYDTYHLQTNQLIPTHIVTRERAIEIFQSKLAGSQVAEDGLKELSTISKLLKSAEYFEDRIRIDPSVVRGLEYYTGPVFEVELTFATDGKDGSPRFGSVGGGGRYDGLVSRFRGEPVPATGFSIGVSRLAAALEYLGKLDSKPGYGPVVVTVFDRDRLADYQTMVAKLRAANIRAELYLGNPKNLGNQLKYADRRHSPCVVIQGSDEKAKGEVTIKDLIVGAELAKLEKGREEHLQKQAEAQRSVPEARLVETVRSLLASHGVT
jgi:histidyl-tRNA synthetase